MLDLHTHYLDAPLSLLGLSAGSTEEEIENAADRELQDLDENFGDAHGIDREEMVDFLTRWCHRAA